VRSTLIIVGIELAATTVVFGAFYAVALRLLRRAAAALSDDHRRSPAFPVALIVRPLWLATLALSALAIVAYNSWLVARGVDVPAYTIGLARSATIQSWQTLFSALAEIGLAVLGLLLAIRIVRRLLGIAQAAASSQPQLQGERLDKVFSGLSRAIVNTGWMLVATLACWLLGAPQSVVDSLLLVVRIYIVGAVGLLLIRSTALIVDVVDRWSRQYADRRGWVQQHDHLRRLLPTFSACVEYALWIGMATLVFAQLRPVRNLAVWGPRLDGTIAIFFLGRVFIEIGHLEIERRMLLPEGLDEMAHRRRATMMPLIGSVFTYVSYFCTAVLILASLGFNPMPFLAGAGILGLVIGFGAQSLINDVVSGFFILFENVYLVGDLIEVDKAKGFVEAIEFRVTKIRDDEGRLHVMRNGDMKPIINYSKDYTMAVVPVEVAYDADLRVVFTTLREAGQQVRARDRNVLAETRIDGITAFGTAAMTVRTSTRVRPGSHDGVAAALRLAIKEGFDRQVPVDAPRPTLIPGAARAGSTG
jgi:small-conductance mechanosensitive channel